jgi:hypothetical protein
MKIGFDATSQGFHGGGFGESGGAFNQQVTIGQQSDQQAINEPWLSNDVALQIVAEAGEGELQTPGHGGLGHVHPKILYCWEPIQTTLMAESLAGVTFVKRKKGRHKGHPFSFSST